MIRCAITGCEKPAVTGCRAGPRHGTYYACADHAAINEHATDVWEVKP